jgi:hypothetical protein
MTSKSSFNLKLHQPQDNRAKQTRLHSRLQEKFSIEQRQRLTALFTV